VVAGVLKDDGSAMPTVVTVSSPAPTGAAQVATGFGVGGDRVVTVAHLLEPGRRLLVRTGDGHAHRARIVRVDRTDDLALLAVPGLAARPPRTTAGGGGPARVLVRRGKRVVAVRIAIRRPVTAHVTGPGTGPYVRPALELAAPVAIGDSGAPVVDENGAVAGIVFARSNGRPGTAYAVDARALASVQR
jgi:S1-C subfamily serine protease